MTKTDRLLEQAIGKITFEMMSNLTNGETIKLNERYSLYKYLEEELFVLKDYGEEFGYSVMYDESNNNSTVLEEF